MESSRGGDGGDDDVPSDLPCIASKPNINRRKSKQGMHRIFVDVKADDKPAAVTPLFDDDDNDDLMMSEAPSIPELPPIKVQPKSRSSRVGKVVKAAAKENVFKANCAPDKAVMSEDDLIDEEPKEKPRVYKNYLRDLPPLVPRDDTLANGKKKKPLYMRMMENATRALLKQTEKKVPLLATPCSRFSPLTKLLSYNLPLLLPPTPPPLPSSPLPH